MYNYSYLAKDKYERIIGYGSFQSNHEDMKLLLKELKKILNNDTIKTIEIFNKVKV